MYWIFYILSILNPSVPNPNYIQRSSHIKPSVQDNSEMFWIVIVSIKYVGMIPSAEGPETTSVCCNRLLWWLLFKHPVSKTASINTLVTQYHVPYTQSDFHCSVPKYPSLVVSKILCLNGPISTNWGLSGQSKTRPSKSEYYGSRNHYVFYVHLLNFPARI
jgi:hypothetical protein